MARNITITFQDGTTHAYQNVPDDVTPDQVHDRAVKEFSKPVTGIDGGAKSAASAPAAAEPSMLSKIGDKAANFISSGGLGQLPMLATQEGRQNLGNLYAGALRGAGSIGATVMRVLPNALGGDTAQENDVRRKAMDSGLQDMGAQPASPNYQVGKVGAEIAGTAGVGGALANGVRVVAPGAAGLGNALATSGFKAGTTTGATNMLTRAAGGAITGGASAGLVDPSSAGVGAIVGGALPGVAKYAGKAGGAIRDAVTGGGASADVAALAQRAKDLGITIPADRLVNSKPLNALASTLNYVPFSGRAATEDAMNSQLNRALSRTFGQDSDNVTMALRKASDDLGGKFDQVLKNNTVKVDDTLLNRLAEIHGAADKELGSDGMKAISGQIDELMTKGASGEMDGQAAYNIKRTLDRIGKRSTPEAFHAREMKGALMEALDRSIGPEEAAKFATTRQQYGNMLSLENIAQNGADGGVSVARMANMKNINNKQLQELADISAQFVKTRESPHGSMQRAMVGGIGAGGAALGAIPGLGLAAGAALGRGTNMALNSNLLRDAMLRSPQPLSEGANQLIQGAYRSAPVLSSR